MSIALYDKVNKVVKRIAGNPGIFSRVLPGLVPQAPSGSGTTKFLREDRAWADVAPAQMIAPVESTSTASRAYAVGEQFVYNGILTEATAAISQGATITVGNSGNAKLADCVMDQVSQLKDALTAHNIGTGVDITSYNTTANKYTTPSDGYIRVTSGNQSYDVIAVEVNGIDVYAKSCQDNRQEFNSLFVRKGMKAYVYVNTGSRGSAAFFPLVE